MGYPYRSISSNEQATEGPAVIAYSALVYEKRKMVRPCNEAR